MTLDTIKARLSQQVETAVEQIAEELQLAVDEAAEEADDEHADEVLDIASERDHLAAELEIARERIAQLEAEKASLLEQLNTRTAVEPRQKTLL